MSGSGEWDNRMMDTLKNFDLNSPEVKQQFGMFWFSLLHIYWSVFLFCLRAGWIKLVDLTWSNSFLVTSIFLGLDAQSFGFWWDPSCLVDVIMLCLKVNSKPLIVFLLLLFYRLKGTDTHFKKGEHFTPICWTQYIASKNMWTVQIFLYCFFMFMSCPICPCFIYCIVCGTISFFLIHNFFSEVDLFYFFYLLYLQW